MNIDVFNYICNQKGFFKDYRPIQFMMDQIDNQTKIFKIKTVLLIILIKNKISRKVKFIKILHAPKISYNLVLNRRLHAHKYYFHGDDDIIQHINNNNKLTFTSLIKKGLHKLLLAEPRMHYASQKNPINIKI